MSDAGPVDNQYALRYKGQEVLEAVHRNGLFLRLPGSLTVKETADGFIVEPPPVRSLSTVIIRLHSGEGLPGNSDAERRVVAGRKLSYRVTEEETGGSGGAAYALLAWEECPGGYISYEHTEQSEMGRPRHEFAWYVIEQAGYRQNK